MTKTLWIAATVLLLAGSAAMAADAITGKWTMTQASYNGATPRVTVFDLKASSSTLTGTVTAPMGGRAGSGGTPTPVEITNGKVKGNTVTFEVVRTFSGKPVTTKYEGKLAGGTMHIKQTLDVGGGAQSAEGDAKREGM